MTNLLIGYPHIPQYAHAVTGSATFSEDYRLYNSIAGEKYTRAELAAGSTSAVHIDYDLGSAGALSAEYVAMIRADLAQDDAVTTFAVHADNTSPPTTSKYSDATFATATLYGTRSTDYIGLFNETSALRYWRATFTPTGTTFARHSKIFLGTFFDFESDPLWIPRNQPAKEGRFYASSGAAYTCRLDEPVYEFEFTWQGVSDDLVRDFYNKIVIHKDLRPVLLYTSGHHELLDNKRLIYCKLTEATTSQMGGTSDFNEVTATFREILG